jgi:hypothetical protein
MLAVKMQSAAPSSQLPNQQKKHAKSIPKSQSSAYRQLFQITEPLKKVTLWS